LERTKGKTGRETEGQSALWKGRLLERQYWPRGEEAVVFAKTVVFTRRIPEGPGGRRKREGGG